VAIQSTLTTTARPGFRSGSTKRSLTWQANGWPGVFSPKIDRNGPQRKTRDGSSVSAQGATHFTFTTLCEQSPKLGGFNLLKLSPSVYHSRRKPDFKGMTVATTAALWCRRPCQHGHPPGSSRPLLQEASAKIGFTEIRRRTSYLPQRNMPVVCRTFQIR